VCIKCRNDLTEDDPTFEGDDGDVLLGAVAGRIKRLNRSYLRLLVHLSHSVPALAPELCRILQEKESKRQKVKLGSSAASVASGAMAIAGAATIMTPVGAPLLLAAFATGGTSTAVEIGSAAARYWSPKEAEKAARKIVGWHGTCVRILSILEGVRLKLLKEHRRLTTDQHRIAYDLRSKKSHIDTLQKGLFSTKVAVAGVQVGSYAGISGAQYLNGTLSSSLQMTPVVGTAISAGTMALSAHSIKSTLRDMKKPNVMAAVLRQVERSFATNVPASIDRDVELLLDVVDDIRRASLPADLPRKPGKATTDSPALVDEKKDGSYDGTE